MPTNVLLTRQTVIENSAVILTARVRDPDTGEALQPADVTSMLLKVFDARTGELVTPDGAADPYTGTNLTVADAVLPALNTGPLAEDADGFNVRVDLDGSYFPDGGTGGQPKSYRVEVKVTPAAGDAFYLLWELKVLAVFSE